RSRARDVGSRPLRADVRIHRVEQLRLGLDPHPRRVRDRGGRTGDLCDARPVALPQPYVQRRQHGDALRRPRDVRDVLLRLAVHAERAPLLTGAGGRVVPADDVPDHPDRAEGREAVRSLRLALARRRRHDAARRDAALLLAAGCARELLGDPARPADRRSRHGLHDDADDGGRDELGAGREGGRRVGGAELDASGRRVARHRGHGRDRGVVGRLRLRPVAPGVPARVPRCTARRGRPRLRGRDRRHRRDPQGRAPPRGGGAAGSGGGVTQTRQRLSAEARRQAVLDTACGVFAASSYRGATTAQIAREAGISEPILYRHFGSKRDLYLACLDEAWRSVRELAEDAIARTPETCLGALLDAFMAKRAKIRLIDLWIQPLNVTGADPVIAKGLRHQIREVHAFFADLIADGQARGVVAADRDARAEAWIFVAGGLLATIDQRLGGLLGGDLERVRAERRRWMHP